MTAGERQAGKCRKEEGEICILQRMMKEIWVGKKKIRQKKRKRAK